MSIKGNIQFTEEWEVKVFALIENIPSGWVVSYSALATAAREKHDLKVTPRQIAAFRRRLYLLLGLQEEIPLHRIAALSDPNCALDRGKNGSPDAREFNYNLRQREGSLVRKASRSYLTTNI